MVASRARGLFCAFSPAREGNLCLSASAACSESRLWPKRGRGGTATRVSDGRMRLGGFSGSGAGGSCCSRGGTSDQVFPGAFPGLWTFARSLDRMRHLCVSEQALNAYRGVQFYSPH